MLIYLVSRFFSVLYYMQSFFFNLKLILFIVCFLLSDEAIHFNTLKNYLLYSNVKTFIVFFQRIEVSLAFLLSV